MPCGAAGIKQRSEILRHYGDWREVRADGIDQGLVAVKTCRGRPVASEDAVLEGGQLITDLRQQRQEFWAHEERVAPRVVEDVGDLTGRQADIERNGQRPHLRSGIIELEIAVAIVHQDRQPVTLGNAQPMQRMAQSVDTFVKAAVGEVRGAANDRSTVGIESYRMFEDLLQIHGYLSYRAARLRNSSRRTHK